MHQSSVFMNKAIEDTKDYGALSEDVDTQKKLHRELFEYINKEKLMKDFI